MNNTIKDIYYKANQERDAKLLTQFNVKLAKSMEQKLLIDKIASNFFGEIEQKGKIATISLNPASNSKKGESKYIPTKEPECILPSKDLIDEKFEEYTLGFKKYEVEPMNRTFLNLSKVLFGIDTTIKSNLEKKLSEFLQKNVINLDFCPFYSANAPDFSYENMSKNGLGKLYDSWKLDLINSLDFLEPKFVFIHGRKLQALTNEILESSEIIYKNINNPNIELWSGYILVKDHKIPAFYSTYFVNNLAFAKHNKEGVSVIEEIYNKIKEQIKS